MRAVIRALPAALAAALLVLGAAFAQPTESDRGGDTAPTQAQSADDGTSKSTRGGAANTTTPTITIPDVPEPISVPTNSYVSGAERITSFRSEIEIAADGTMRVHETIRVVSRGEDIRRGIFRDFPTDYHDRDGARVRVRFDVESVKRDGRDEPYFTESIDNGVRLYIGDEDVFITRGEHTYDIVYATDRQLTFGKDFDELYWNVTGNGWDFRIDTVEAIVHLPGDARMLESDVYTGIQGSRDKSADIAREKDGREVHFRTTRYLDRHEGMTIALSWPKGFVTEPTSADRAGYFIEDNFAAGLAILAVLLTVGYYLRVWSLFGKDPERGNVYPLFDPPKGFTAPAVRFVRRMGYDRKSFAAALLSMAVKGYLRIEEEKSTFTLHRLKPADAGLSAGEKAIMAALFKSGDLIELKNVNHAKVSAAISGLREALRNEYEKVYFVTNAKWFWIGIAISIVTGGIAMALSDMPAVAVVVGVMLTLWITADGFLLWRLYVAWRDVVRGVGSRIKNTILAVLLTVAAGVFLGAPAFVLFMMRDEIMTATPDLVSVIVFFCVGLLGVVNIVFYYLMKAPTLAGARIIDAIDGFKMYLGTAEKERMAVLNPPKMTPERFEKFLPYALALDVEHEWSETFAREIETQDPSARGYAPTWYVGSSWSRLGAAGFASNLGSSVGSAIASSATAPGSSSGIGGGGFSGGGGGGGGGGGW